MSRVLKQSVRFNLFAIITILTVNTVKKILLFQILLLNFVVKTNCKINRPLSIHEYSNGVYPNCN